MLNHFIVAATMLPDPSKTSVLTEKFSVIIVFRVMAEVGFYIDTRAKEEDVEEDEDEEEKDAQEDGRVLGGRNAAVEKQQRDRAAKERSLASFLFGKITDDVKEVADDDAESEEEDDEDESDLEDDNIDVDSDNEKVDEEGENSEEDDESEEESSSVQPSLPSDVFGGALNLPVNKRKRKAAWVDKDDAHIMVKDVVATYTKAKGKHGLAEVSEELYGKALNRKFKSVVGEPAWANLDRDKGEDGDSDEEFLRETTNLTQKRSKGGLQRGELVYRKLKVSNNKQFICVFWVVKPILSGPEQWNSQRGGGHKSNRVPSNIYSWPGSTSKKYYVF